MDETSTLNDVKYLLTQLSTQIEQLNAKVMQLETALSLESQTREGEGSTLSNNVDSLQNLVNLNSGAITNETVDRSNADIALDSRISDLTSVVSADKAYLIGEIERHHDELLDQTLELKSVLQSESLLRAQGETQLENLIDTTKQQLDAAYSAIETRVDVYEEALDTTTVDMSFPTADSDVTVDWSILSASQEWRIEIGKYLSDTQFALDDRMREILTLVQNTQATASQALENTDIGNLVSSITGAIGMDVLDPELANQIKGLTDGLAQEKLDRANAIIAEAVVRQAELSAALNPLSDAILQETQDRIDAIANEAVVRNQLLTELESRVNETIGAKVTESISTGVVEDLVVAEVNRRIEAEIHPNIAGSDTYAGNESSVSYENSITALVDSDTAIYKSIEEAKTVFTDGLTITEGKIRDLTFSLSDLDSNVTQRMETLESQFTNEINTSIANLENNYYTITAADAAISVATTQLSSTLTQNYESAILDALETVTVGTTSTQEILDQRLTNHPVSWYRSNYAQKRVIELKDAVTVGLTVAMLGQTTGTLTTSVPWGDVSGGAVKQVLEGSDDLHRWVRYSTGLDGAETWTPWVNTTQSFTTSLEETSTTIDGIKAVKTVTVDNNGVLSGYGLISELTEGVVTSAFGINANQFYVGSPVDGRKMFVVTTEPTVIGGVNYPPGTWFDTANIATASIGTAHIQDAAIDSAKIANASIDSAKITDGSITNAKLANASITAAKIVDGEITNAKIGSAAITTSKISNLAVDTLRIADRAVTAPILVSKGAGTIVRPGYGWAPNEYPVQEFIRMTVSGLAANTYVLITLLGKISVTFGGGYLERVDNGTFYLKLGDTFLYNYNKAAGGGETVYYDQVVGNDSRGSAYVTLVKSDASGNIILTGSFGAFTFHRYVDVTISWSTLQLHLVELKK